MDQATKDLIENLRKELKFAEQKNIELAHRLAVMKERERLRKVAVLQAVEAVMDSDAPLMRTVDEASSPSGLGRHAS